MVAAVILIALALPGGARAQSASPQQLTVNLLGEPDAIDPSLVSFTTDGTLVLQAFEPLLTFDASLPTQPAAAESFDVSPDGTQYTFHLRPDGRFSDGTPVTAADFVYSLRRLLDPKTAASGASFFVDAGIVGAADFNSGKTADPSTVGVAALDDLTLQITLQAPAPQLPELMALAQAVPLRQAVVEANPTGWTLDPSTYVGNGPFVVTEWAHQDHISFAPNPQFHGPGPSLQQLTFLLNGDVSTDYLAYLNGERDVAIVPDGDVAAVLGDASLAPEVRHLRFLGTSWLFLNVKKAPLDNVLVRRAFNRGIDRQAYVRDVAGGLGHPATSLLPPGLPGSDEALGKDLDFDPAAARTLLAQAGYADPSRFPRLSLKYPSGSDAERRVEFLQAQLKQNLGIAIDLQPMETKAYEEAYKAKQLDLALGGWLADYPDPQDFLEPIFGCAGGYNAFAYCNPAYDALVRQAGATTDPTARAALYAQAQQVLDQDAPGVWLINPERLARVKPYVRGLIITPMDGYPGERSLAQVSIVGQ